MKTWLILALFSFLFVFISADQSPASARIESCPGCSLNRLPEVKRFIYDDIPLYDGVTFKKIQGAPPELVLLNSSDEQIDRIALSSLTRQECNELLQKHGFKKLSNKNDL